MLIASTNCKKVIENKKASLPEEDWAEYADNMSDKLLVIYLNNQLSNNEYNELMLMLHPENAATPTTDPLTVEETTADTSTDEAAATEETTTGQTATE